MTRMGDTTEIMGRILHTGEVESRAREAEAARSRAAIAKNQATAKAASAERNARELRDDLDAMASNFEKHKKESAKALAERDVLLREWMHSNEAFKRLARKYGKELQVTDEQRDRDFRGLIVDLAEEDPNFAGTKLEEKAKAHLATAAKP